MWRISPPMTRNLDATAARLQAILRCMNQQELTVVAPRFATAGPGDDPGRGQ
jgi:hypothetical protein